MASFVAKIISKKILKERLENNFGREDPYFEQVPATRLDGTPSGKVKKRRKALPPGISEQDGQVLTKVKRRAYRLDMSLFNFMGIRFGWGSVIGFVPAIGDALDMFMALMVFKTCTKVDGGLPSSVKTRMLLNIIIDFVVGLVPFVGDIADAAFRANTKNAILLEEHLREKGKKNLRQSGVPIPAIDPSVEEEYDRLNDPEPPAYVSRVPSRHEHTSSRQDNGSAPSAPPVAKVRENKRAGSGGFFGFGRSRADDVEMGKPAPEPKTGPAKLARRGA